MFDFVNTADVKQYKSFCADKLNQLKNILSNEYGLECSVCLIGSGAKNLVTQNANEPFDLDYNLIIHSLARDWNPNESENKKWLKDTIRKELNKLLGKKFRDAQDSTSVLTARFIDNGKRLFSFDLAIIIKNCQEKYFRLIHDKDNDCFYWNEVPYSLDVEEKVTELKENGWWQDVRDVYLEKKNMYLTRNDTLHPSFIVYVESVNQVFNEFENYCKENNLGEKFICPYCGAEKDSEDEICPVCNDDDDDD